ncbi:hypothetical protein KP509_09G093300 [Ceratopteris richardii]|uniref:UDENN domain-containing protein n=1 Tax=Ceratopteris richardii TaxID=49495 RepID=A0A8T2U971_CERRI|nr:hypothetical protein KP509_09G093300 [Ceratopteris richardii]
MRRTVSLGVPNSEPNSRSDTGGLRRWILAICAIRFDLEQGQVVEACYPSGAISHEEELDVAFSSFPDSMSQGHNRTSVYDCMFFFRIRRRGTVSASPSNANLPHTTLSATADPFNAENRLSTDGHSTGEKVKQRDSLGGFAMPKDGIAVTSGGRETVNRKVSRESSVSFDARFDGICDDEAGRRWSLSGIFTNLVSPNTRPRSFEADATSQRSSNLTAQAANIQGTLFGTSGSQGGPGSGGPRYLYGFVFNRQRKDERLRRGGEQKSVVILSERPYSIVFRSLLQILGPLYFDIGPQALEQVAVCVSQWPGPVHGAAMELPVGNVTLRVHLPPAHTLPPGCGTPMDDFTSAMAPSSHLNLSIPHGIFHEADVFGIFKGILMQLWELWELVLIGEPLLVVAPTPSQCCEAVAALVGLMAPLPCSIDFRPYFTIHDPDFAVLNSLREGEQVPSMILGVTNLFFLRVMRTLPHVVSVGSSLDSSNKITLVTRSNIPNNGNNNQGRLQLHLQLSPLKKFSPMNILKNARIKRDGPLCLMTEHREALWTNYTPSTKPDTAVLNRLVDAGPASRIESSMSLVNNEILRRHFLELTTNFLAPFGPYLRATTPQEGSSPFVDPPPLPPFDAHEFLEGLAARGPGKFLTKRLQSNWLELYRRFLKGPNFMPWFQRRRAVAEHEQHRIWRQARLKADIRTFISKMSELEVIDSFNAVERHLLVEMQRAGVGGTDSPACSKLRGDLRTIFNVLPADMQQLMVFNPQKAALLQGSKEFVKVPGRLSVLVSKSSESSPSEGQSDQF